MVGTAVTTERLRETDEQISRVEREYNEQISFFLRAINRKDSVSSASRRAYQHLDRECKESMLSTLRSFIELEREYVDSRNRTLNKLEEAVENIDIDTDTNEFISGQAIDINYNIDDSDGPLLLRGEALRILDDVMVRCAAEKAATPPLEGSKGTRSSNETMDATGNIHGGSTRSDREALSPSLNTMMLSHIDDNILDEAIHDLHNHHIRSPDSDVIRRDLRRSTITSFNDGMHIDIQETLSSPAVRRGTDPTGLSSNNSGVNSSHNDGTIKDKGEGSPPRDTLGDQAAGLVPHLRLLLRGQSFGTITNLFISPDAVDLHRLHKLKDQSPQAILDYCYQYLMTRPVEESNDACVEKTILWLCKINDTQYGRDLFVTALNQFRSKKCDIGVSAIALNAVLWDVIDKCLKHNDIHTSKVVMMLSQTFYTSTTRHTSHDVEEEKNGDDTNKRETTTTEEKDEEKHTYLKDTLATHPLWSNIKFWEQMLWECIIEQLQTIPYENRWYELEDRERRNAVMRVRNGSLLSLSLYSRFLVLIPVTLAHV